MKEIKEKIKHSLSNPYWLIACGLLPCLLTIFFQVKAEKKLHRLSEDARYLKKKQQLTEQKRKLQQGLLTQMQKAHRDYLENEIESLQFMLPEIQKLQAFLHLNTNNEENQKRLNYLQSGQNSLRFRQQNFQRVGSLQEMEAKQLHPVEMNREDLKNLLARIENLQIGKIIHNSFPPDLLIKNIEVIKKPLPSDEEVFLVNLELIKREMIRD
jgi:hypothetical protein